MTDVPRHRLFLVPAVAFLALIAAACSTPDQLGVQRIDEPMPKLEGPTVQGETLAAADYQGSPLVINFWASWCAPCRREQPMLEALSQQYADRGVKFIGVNSRNQLAEARAFVDEFDVTYPSVVDPANKVAFEFGMSLGLPGTVIVDSTGTIRYRKQGEITKEELVPLIDEVASSTSAQSPTA